MLHRATQNHPLELEATPSLPSSQRPEQQRMITAKCTSCSVKLKFPEGIKKIQCSVCRAMLPTRSLFEEVPTPAESQHAGPVGSEYDRPAVGAEVHALEGTAHADM